MKISSLFCFFIFSSTRPVCYSTDKSSSLVDLHQFNLWRIKYNKTYENEFNLNSKFSAWRRNREFINDYNKNYTDYSLELNYFADLYHPQWLHRKSYNQPMSKYENPIQPLNEIFRNFSLPNSVDWRDENAVTPIKNQEQCGSCWAFSAVGSMEGQYAIKTGRLVSLSESQIIDCDINGSDSGCNGGFMNGAFRYVIDQGGIDTDSSYPYKPREGKCMFNKSNSTVSFSTYSKVNGGEINLKMAVATIGPIAVGIDASSPQFKFYKTGVYYDASCSSTMLDHGVLVVGYGTTVNGSDYWIVKNSWGVNWGDKGYVYMSRNRNNNCGIASSPSYPVM
uniref:Peptidase C1A papain C-terminal domain-containing protein n=1 Tax=viral metagenome TaxID=1070528 RepID=A0A6C0C612_9ZZZZ